MTDSVLKSLLGTVLAADAASALGGAFAKYVSDFATFEATHWDTDGSVWSNANYYDRAKIEYTAWQATGDPVHLNRGDALAENYLHNEVLATNTVPANWSFMDGLTAHYLLHNDAESLRAIGKTADSFASSWITGDNWANFTDPHFAEGREQARALEAFVDATMVKAPSLGAPNIQPDGADWGVPGGNDFRALAGSLVEKLLSDQHNDGSRPSFVTTTASGEAIDKPFMNGLLNDAMIDYYETVNADPRIIQYIKANLDYMWSHEWDAQAGAFQYLDQPAPADPNGANPAPDVNSLVVNGFGFVYAHTGDPTYLDRGDQVFTGGVDGAWLVGSKQFNQQYTSSYKYLAYTHGDLASATTAPRVLSSVPSLTSSNADPVKAPLLESNVQTPGTEAAAAEKSLPGSHQQAGPAAPVAPASDPVHVVQGAGPQSVISTGEAAIPACGHASNDASHPVDHRVAQPMQSRDVGHSVTESVPDLTLKEGGVFHFGKLSSATDDSSSSVLADASAQVSPVLESHRACHRNSDSGAGYDGSHQVHDEYAHHVVHHHDYHVL